MASMSAGAVELLNTIGHSLGLELPGTLVFDCPTAGDITRYILDNFQPPAAAPAGTAATPGAAAGSASSGRFSRAAAAAAAASAEPRLTREAVAAIVADAVQTLLGEGVAPDAPLLAAGLDSLAAVELRNDISRQVHYSSRQTALETNISPSGLCDVSTLPI